MALRKRKSSQNKIDVDSHKSSRRGLAGAFESFFRRHRDTVHILIILPLYLFAAGLAGVAFTPGIYLFHKVQNLTAQWPEWAQYMATGSSLVMGYFLYGFSMVILLPLFNRVFGLRLKPWRGPYYSLPSIPWYIHNGTTYLLRYTFLELITPTPMSILFYKGMGMKIGRGSVINSTAISDPSLITLGEKVTIGGSVTIVGHYGQGGFLVLAPVVIGDRVTVGLRATIMGGVTIGKEAKILPHSVVMPKTVIPAGETWGGVPARKIEESEFKVFRKPA
jgi:acetyltransferase-like isoleucine patch superfamily enzyme